jgi:hypothetical protein
MAQKGPIWDRRKIGKHPSREKSINGGNFGLRGRWAALIKRERRESFKDGEGSFFCLSG